QLRDHHPNAANPGQWGLFGGEAEAGESLAEAAAREMAEEIGVSIPAAAFRPFARTISARSRKRLYAFTAEIAFGPEAVRLGEGAGFAFIERRDLARLDLVASVRVILAAWASRG
ncbi:MAG: NUDIX domain-containing protein, partial [Pseudomonadota bacterium]